MPIRSVILGSVFPTQYVLSVQMACPLQQADQLISQHIEQQGHTYLPLDGSRPARPTAKSKSAYCTGYELYVNEWDEAINQTIREIHSDCSGQPPRARVQRLRQTLAYWLAPYEQSVVLVQLDLAAREHNQTVLNIQLAWNREAPEQDTNKAHRFIRHLFNRLKQLNIHVHHLTNHASRKPIKAMDTSRRRDETVQKLEKLEAVRNQSKRGGHVTISRTRACREARLSPSTLEKWNPLLVERWLDPTY